MPAAVTDVNRDIKSDIHAGLQPFGKIKVGDIGLKTEIVARNLFDKYPNLDKLLTLQTMAATYCSMLKESDLSSTEKLIRWESFQEKVLNLKMTSQKTAKKATKQKRATKQTGTKQKISVPVVKTKQNNPSSSKSVDYDDDFPFDKTMKSETDKSVNSASGKTLRYTRVPENDFDDASIEITPISQSRVRVTGIALYGKQNKRGPNIGELNFESEIDNGQVSFTDPDPFNKERGIYHLDLMFKKDGLTVEEKNANAYGFFGMNVSFGGEYRKELPFGNLRESITSFDDEFLDIDMCTEKSKDGNYMNKYKKALKKFNEIGSLARDLRNEEALSWFNQRNCFGKHSVVE